MKIFFTIVFMFISSLGFAEGRSSLGFIGDSCSIFLQVDESYSDEEFRDVFGVSEIRGFLTGMNVYYYLYNENLKIIDVDEAEEIFDYLIVMCRANPEDDVYVILTKYFASLPDYQ